MINEFLVASSGFLNVSNWLEEPLETPAAWHGRELALRDDWVFTPQPGQLDELTSAARSLEDNGKG